MNDKDLVRRLEPYRMQAVGGSRPEARHPQVEIARATLAKEAQGTVVALISVLG